MVRFGIERVVNRVAIRGAKSPIVIHNRRTTAVSKNKIVFGNEREKRISRVSFHTRQGCGSIHVPEGDPGSIGLALQNFFFQQLIEYTHTAVLHHKVARGGLLQQRGNIIRIFVNNCVYVTEIAGVTVLQTAISIGLGKCNLVSKRVQLLVNASIIRSRAIPIRRGNAGAKNENLHREISWQISISCCALCAQVWRSRMVLSPFSASW